MESDPKPSLGTILAVDDNPENLGVIFHCLEKTGYVVLLAQSGESALELVREKSPDLILLDVLMPEGLNGYETCRQLKSDPKTRDIPVLFLSSLSETGDKVRGFEAGGVDYITKPFHQEEILARVNTHVHLFRLKNQLEKKNERLKMEVAERKRAEGEAADANRAKTEFLANMSHELRTPLNGILGYAQILKRDRNITGIQQKGLAVIEKSGTHLLHLINGILDLSKIEARKMEVALTRFLFPSFLATIVELIKVQARDKGLSFVYDPADDLPEGVCADEKRLRQVLLNLLGNAVKFTRKGSVTFRVRNMGRSDACPGENNFRIFFSIGDTGPGIPCEKFNDIFSPFKQLKMHTRAIEGTGLGLSISRKLIELMGGELLVESTLGSGSLFSFELLLPEALSWEENSSAKEDFVTGYSGEKKKILVVDDKWENRAVLVGLLEPLGFLVTEAANGRECLELAADISPDLIFMDLIMPVMDGFTATRQLGKKKGKMKIIAVSASTLMPREQLCREIGCDDYIPKPVQFQEILDKTAIHLGIEWQYEDRGPDDTESIVEKTFEEIRFPSPVIIKEWREFVMDGNFEALDKRIVQVEKLDLRYKSFVGKVRRLAADFDEDGLMEFFDKDTGGKAL